MITGDVGVLSFADLQIELDRGRTSEKLDTRSARLALKQSREPYWGFMDRNCHVGYRRGAEGGTWIARMRDEEGQRQYEALASARTLFHSKARELAGDAEPKVRPYTVAVAVSDYLAERERKGSKGVRADRYAADARILPTLGTVEIARLTAKTYPGMAS